MTATIITDTPRLTIAVIGGHVLSKDQNRTEHPDWCYAENGTPVGDCFYLVLCAALREYRAKGAA